MITFQNEGTVIHSNIFYILNNGKREHFDKYPTNISPEKVVFEFDAYMYPPLFLLPQTWKRYDYSLKDVILTCKAFDASYLWQLYLMVTKGIIEPESSTAGFDSSFQSLFIFNFKFRKVENDYIKFYSHWITDYDEQKAKMDRKESSLIPSALCTKYKDHKPYLPIINLTTQEFNKLKRMLPNREPSLMWVGLYDSFFVFKDIKLIPVRFDQKRSALYLVRILAKDIYDNIPCQPKKCAITTPAIVIIDKIKYVLLEEACFGVNKKRQMISNASFSFPNKNKKKRIK